jgi:hypothetical protein
MEGYTQGEYFLIDGEEDSDDDSDDSLEDEFILKLKKTAKTIKYSTILKEEEFIEE